MKERISRRRLMRFAVYGGLMVPWLSDGVQAAGLPPLDASDPTAKALGFVSDSTKVDAAANPTHKPTQKCGTCAQFQGKAGDASGGCNIFTGHSVPQGGWCKVWAQKPGA